MGIFSGDKPTGFIDLSRLRFGAWLDTYQDPSTGLWTIKYRESYPNGGVKKVEKLSENSWHKVNKSYLGEDGKYKEFVILHADNQPGDSYMDEYWGKNGIVSDLVRKMDEQKKDMSVRASTQRAIERKFSRGKYENLKDVADNMKVVGDANQKQFGFQNFRQRR